jgi:maleate isomerase
MTRPPEAPRSASIYGTRGTLGFIDLSTCTSLTPEVSAAMPDDVLALFSRIRLPRGAVDADALGEMLATRDLENAALELADGGAEVIVFGCTSGSLLLGPGFDAELSARIQNATGVPGTTTATAVVAALRRLGVQTVCVGTPYLDDINRRELAFLRAAGFDVPSITGLGLTFDRDIGALELEAVRRLAHRAADRPSDALFLSCTNLPSLTLIPELEVELDRPVVTSNSATAWYALDQLGLAPHPGMLGRLSARVTA